MLESSFSYSILMHYGFYWRAIRELCAFSTIMENHPRRLTACLLAYLHTESMCMCMFVTNILTLYPRKIINYLPSLHNNKKIILQFYFTLFYTFLPYILYAMLLYFVQCFQMYLLFLILCI